MNRRRFKHSLKISCFALYLLGNVAGLVLIGQDWSGQGDVASHVCTAHTVLMTNISPDIHC